MCLVLLPGPTAMDTWARRGRPSSQGGERCRMGFYAKRVFPRIMNRLMDKPEN